MEGETNKIEDGEKKVKLSTLIYGILIIFIVFFGAVCIMAYGTNTEIGKKMKEKISKAVPFPAAIINYRNFVYADDVANGLASIEKFYASQDFSKEGFRIDFTTPDGQKRLKIKEREIFDKLVEDKIIEMLAQKRGITVAKADVDEIVSQKLEEYGTENDVKGDLLKSYGWSIEDFKERIVIPNIYKEALVQYVESKEIDNSKNKAEIGKAQKELEKGTDFAEVVKEFSKGKSKENGGELGWVVKDQLAPEIQEALFGTKKYEKNSIIESSIGFHIIDIENEKKENGESVLQLRQIFVSKENFASWLEKQKKDMTVLVPRSDFVWDKATGSIDFRDKEMRKFEKEERSKMQGDASIMF